MSDEPDFDPTAYGPAFAELMTGIEEQPLDAGAEPRRAGALEDLSVETAFGHTAVTDRGAAECCVAGVWLLHGFLDAAHRLCQDVPTASGSYWHGVVHRREGDFGNAKYWFGRAAGHPAGDRIAAAASGSDQLSALGEGGDWDATGFVDRCREALRSGDARLEAECRALQAAEWRAVFDSCYREATG